MTQKEFIDALEAHLKYEHVSDIEDIIAEYNQHFAFKLTDGYTEEEICTRLGDPSLIAEQYCDSDDTSAEKSAKNSTGKSRLTALGLYIADFFVGNFYILLFAWEIVMSALVVAFAAVAIGLFINVRSSVFALIPSMPYHCAFIFASMFSALSILTLMGSIYFFAFIKQLMRSWARFHKNTLSSLSGGKTLPSVSPYPTFAPKTKRIIRRISLISAVIFSLCFIVGFIAGVISAGSVGFWHAWNWFV